MRSIRALKYGLPFILFLAAGYAFTARGWTVWLPMMLVWVLIPSLELLIPPRAENLSSAEEEMARQDKFYDYLLYLSVPMQYLMLYLFLWSMQDNDITGWERIARIGAMGILCGSFGINVAHELGHRVNRFEQFLAKSLLLTSLYMHFFTEHNKGHHKRVATPEDPSSARYGEMLYTFWFRTVFMGYLSAWHIAGEECSKKGRSKFGLHNEMIRFQLLQVGLISLIYWTFGGWILLYFLAAAAMGILLLETVNYIEHYGLQRKATGEGTYERAMPEHSWNSDHMIGRLFLFELSRHSDHHYLASRKYQILRHHDGSPQMPTGYPGMILLSLLPPAWFAVMNPRIKKMAD
ncbi:MAG: alkane 1-monooxygenase [Bacteroidota bacterium]